ncbi:helix-turn-helix domain-containing protein [Acinetobacter sp. Tr-809]|uniref:AraC family transcriptional regulator n=1 Tax=Acinetobacter sp. Tr-809 TaxID=2608324 RepID=UPI0014225061|nr:helix-turn-helix domain-containing protein [Acinetobacter sp. Tr-809]NIE97505.1 helix-turn-helix domain-containing protein [Acinetobacter sp. Tr-809]
MNSLKNDNVGWSGQAAIALGIGAFLGQSGNNHPHHHYAHQITISLNVDQPVQVIADGQLYQAPTLFIPAKLKHQLITGDYLSIYIDTCHALTAKFNLGFHAPTQVCEVSIDLQQQLQHSFSSKMPLNHGLAHFLKSTQLSNPAPHGNPQKIEHILELLYQGILQANIPDRQYLAQIVGLSESRFSHWFREQAGLPLRSYRKWLRLICGLTQIQKGLALTDTAHQADFADQAHFTRTCVELLGVRPSELNHMQGQIFFID